MSDEIKIKTEELPDEQMNKASGGGPLVGDPSKLPRKCANPNCNVILPYDYPDALCKNCQAAASEEIGVTFGLRKRPKIDP